MLSQPRPVQRCRLTASFSDSSNSVGILQRASEEDSKNIPALSGELNVSRVSRTYIIKAEPDRDGSTVLAIKSGMLSCCRCSLLDLL